MDGVIGLLMLLLLFIIAGTVLAFVAFFRVNALRQQVEKLSDELESVRQKPATTASAEKEPMPSQTKPQESAATYSKPVSETQTDFAGFSEPQPLPNWQQHLIDNWMTWLGGISVALAGIFMVKHSINMGLLGPEAQITLAILTGLGLHVAADWLRRRNGGSDPVFASLAGGASITLYAALLAALHIYHLIDPLWVFIALAVVSLMTMLLSLLHGPMLAMIGLVGAYVVPILVSTGSGNIFAAMVYSLIITAAGLLLVRYVSKSWLWWSVVAGAMGWWLLSLTSTQPEQFRGLYLAIFAWALLAIPSFDWLLQAKGRHMSLWPDKKTIDTAIGYVSMNQLVLLLIVLAWGASVVWQGRTAIAFELWAPLVVVACVAAAGRDSLKGLAWFSLMVQCAAWFLVGADVAPGSNHFQLSPFTGEQQDTFLIFTGLMALLYSGLSAWLWLKKGFSHALASLTLLSPLVWLALAYLLVTGLAQSLAWSITTFMVGLLYGLVAARRIERDKTDKVALWTILAAHFAYSLAVALFFREASLSLALAAQLLSLSWLLKRYQLPWLDTLIKALLTVVVVRLTLNPWLAGYPVDVHWSLWTYGGATVFAVLASRQCLPGTPLRAWLEAASLHLFVMTLGAELRYWLYDGQIFIERYDLVEAAINASLWAGLALTYQYRARFSESLSKLYQVCSKVLLLMALSSYGIAALVHNPWWSGDVISSTPVFNILLLAYGAPIIWALLVAYYHEPKLRKPALGFAGFAVMLFITLEIRQLWQGGDLSLNNVTSDGELYTYSVVWMLMAIAGVLLGTRWRVRDVYKVGMALLAVVIAKIFLVDMSGLDGLWRVAAFMGLGLAMLALAWFYKRMQGEVTSD